MKSNRKAFHTIHCIMSGLFVCVVVYLILITQSKPLAETQYDQTTPFESGWHTEDGTELNEKTLRKLKNISPSEEISIFNTIPADLANADALFFRAKNVFYSVYINGKNVYEPKIGESVFYTNSTGTRWNCIDLTPKQCGKEIEIKVRVAYENARCGLDGFRIGSSAGAVMNVMQEKMVAFITCVLMLFVGVLLSVADIPINIRSNKNHELLYLGVFSICIATWCLSELNIIQFFFDNSRAMQVVSCGSLMLIPIPLMLYLDSVFGFKTKFVMPAVCVASAVEFVVCWGLHLFGIKDIHETLTLSHIMLAVSAGLLIYSIIKNMVTQSKKQGANIYSILRTIGLCSIAVAAFIDITRYYSGQTSDSAQFVRVGLLIFIICFGASSLENTIKAVKKGAQTEFISQLAYHDGLTGVGNRTAFQERLDELEKSIGSNSVGLVMFDVNDLKYVNDNLGHSLGDSMSQTAAEIISGSFEECGECFRIGGDEFAVIITGTEDIQKAYDDGEALFKEKCALHNNDPASELRISIAHGFFLYSKNGKFEKVAEGLREADRKMYEDKRVMKTNQTPPAEYYAERQTKAV